MLIKWIVAYKDNYPENTLISHFADMGIEMLDVYGQYKKEITSLKIEKKRLIAEIKRLENRRNHTRRRKRYTPQ